ncbi:MAG TPA: GGDEF domain-containing protein [Spirochaetota bacterium]|nr:GGDEF domain-containing protein [Spirochaetota bacterium]
MKHLRLQTKLTACIMLTSAVLIILSFYLLNKAWQENRKAGKILEINNGAGYFITVIKDLTFERGRTNVVLLSGETVTPADREFIDDRRKSVDAYMSQGINWLEKIDKHLADKIHFLFLDFISLRKQADILINRELPDINKSEKLSKEWFRQSSNLIKKIIEALYITAKRENLHGDFEYYFSYLIDLLEFRDTIGRSGSMITASIARGKYMAPGEFRECITYLAQADYLWSKMEVTAAAVNDQGINRQKSVVHHNYYKLYRPELEDIIKNSSTKNIPVQQAKMLQKLSVTAFDSVFNLREQIKTAILTNIKTQKQNSMIYLALSTVQFIFGVSVISFTILYFRKNLFIPLTNITEAIEKIREGENAPDLSNEITRPDEIGLLAEGVKMLQISMHEERELRILTEEMALTDKLTGLNNRHYLEKIIKSILTKSDRYDEKVSLVIFDLDHFKQVNDTMGHPAGDAVLKQTANIARSLIRNSDILIRFGGEEFLILMPHTSSEGAVLVSEKIRMVLEKNIHPGVGAVTASFGISEKRKDESFNSWYSRADQALYNAKESGRNRVITAET